MHFVLHPTVRFMRQTPMQKVNKYAEHHQRYDLWLCQILATACANWQSQLDMTN